MKKEGEKAVKPGPGGGCAPSIGTGMVCGSSWRFGQGHRGAGTAVGVRGAAGMSGEHLLGLVDDNVLVMQSYPPPGDVPRSPTPAPVLQLHTGQATVAPGSCRGC